MMRHPLHNYCDCTLIGAREVLQESRLCMQKSSELPSEPAAKDGEQTHENSPINASQAASETHPGAPAALLPQPSISHGNRHEASAHPASCPPATGLVAAAPASGQKPDVNASPQSVSGTAAALHSAPTNQHQQQQPFRHMNVHQAVQQNGGYSLGQGQNQQFLQHQEPALGSKMLQHPKQEHQQQQQQQQQPYAETRMLLAPFHVYADLAPRCPLVRCFECLAMSQQRPCKYLERDGTL